MVTQIRTVSEFLELPKLVMMLFPHKHHEDQAKLGIEKTRGEEPI